MLHVIKDTVFGKEFNRKKILKRKTALKEIDLCVENKLQLNIEKWVGGEI